MFVDDFETVPLGTMAELENLRALNDKMRRQLDTYENMMTLTISDGETFQLIIKAGQDDDS